MKSSIFIQKLDYNPPFWNRDIFIEDCSVRNPEVSFDVDQSLVTTIDGSPLSDSLVISAERMGSPGVNSNEF